MKSEPKEDPAEPSFSQRPKRNAGTRSSQDGGGALLWKEEKELKKALYASLQENKRLRGEESDRASEFSEAPSKEKEQQQPQQPSPKSCCRTKVHAQRKFAQGSTPSSPAPTPVKAASTSAPNTEFLPHRRPNTEDFLTFLCLRGTPILPPSLDFLNHCSEYSSRSTSPEPGHPPKLSTTRRRLCHSDDESSVPGGGKGPSEKGSFKKKTVSKISASSSQKKETASSKMKALKEKYKKQRVEKKKKVIQKSSTPLSKVKPKPLKSNASPPVVQKKPARILRSSGIPEEKLLDGTSLPPSRAYLKRPKVRKLRKAKLVPLIVDFDSDSHDSDDSYTPVKQPRKSAPPSLPAAKTDSVKSSHVKVKKTLSAKQPSTSKGQTKKLLSMPNLIIPKLQLDKKTIREAKKRLAVRHKGSLGTINVKSQNSSKATAAAYKQDDLSSSDDSEDNIALIKLTSRIKLKKLKAAAALKQSRARLRSSDDISKLSSEKDKKIPKANSLRPSKDSGNKMLVKEKVKAAKCELNRLPKANKISGNKMKASEKLLVLKSETKSATRMDRLKGRSNGEQSKDLGGQEKSKTSKGTSTSDHKLRSKKSLEEPKSNSVNSPKSKLVKESAEPKVHVKEEKPSKVSQDKHVEEKSKVTIKSVKLDVASSPESPPETPLRSRAYIKRRSKLRIMASYNKLRSLRNQRTPLGRVTRKAHRLHPLKRAEAHTFRRSNNKSLTKLLKKVPKKTETMHKENTPPQPSSSLSKEAPQSPSETELPYKILPKENSPCVTSTTPTLAKDLPEVPASQSLEVSEADATVTESSTYIIDGLDDGSTNFEDAMASEMAQSIPGDLVFGNAEEIHSLMSSEFSGVFDDAFSTGAILLTSRDTLPAPSTFPCSPEVSKVTVDASTNTSEDDLLPSQSAAPSVTGQSDEISVGTQTIEPSKPKELKVQDSECSSSTPSIPFLPPPKKKPRPHLKAQLKQKSLLKCNTKLQSFPKATDTPAMVEAPIYRPTPEEFQDPILFIQKILPEAEKYGICRIIPPESFKPDCKVQDEMRFSSYNQYIHKMLYRWGPNVQDLACIRKQLRNQGISFIPPPLIGGIELDLARLHHTIQQLGGPQIVIEKKKWQKVADIMRIPKTAQDRVTRLYEAYCKYLVPYATLSTEDRLELEEQVETQREATGLPDPEDGELWSNFCVTKGRSMSLNHFNRLARNTMTTWYKSEPPSAEEVEADYWRLVADRKQHVVVHSGSVDSNIYGSGFSSNKSSPYGKHPWNLKVMTNHNSTVLRCLGPVSGLTTPTLHLAMLFTTGCWYRDPHGLPWIEYLHVGGASKIWYGVPASSSDRFRKAMLHLMPEVCADSPIWLPSDVAMVPPSLLVEQGTSLSRTVQSPGQFVVIFPGSFTSNLSCGFCLSESVYFALPSWLESANCIFQEIKRSKEPPTFSLEKLVFSIAGDTKVSVSTLQRVYPLLEQIIEVEVQQRQRLATLGLKNWERLPEGPQQRKWRNNVVVPEPGDQECEICRGYCHLSLVVNSLEDTVFCLEHACQHLSSSKKKNNLKHCKLLFTLTEEEMRAVAAQVQTSILDKGEKLPRKKVGGKMKKPLAAVAAGLPNQS